MTHQEAWHLYDRATPVWRETDPQRQGDSVNEALPILYGSVPVLLEDHPPLDGSPLGRERLEVRQHPSRPSLLILIHLGPREGLDEVRELER